MEIKKKYRCGNWMVLLFLCTVLALTGCMRREDVFLEEITSEEEPAEGKAIEESRIDEDCDTADGITENVVSNIPSETTVPQKIFVDVCGAVANPGVYELDEGARVFQAVNAAGGYLPEAAVNYLNRARSLGDGQQIYVPTEEEIAENLEALASKVPEALQSGASEDTGREGNSEDSLAEGVGSNSGINLNTADAAQLCTLSGIGQSKAEAIIAYREEHGGFASIEEIMNVEGIKEGTFSKIKDKISVG